MPVHILNERSLLLRFEQKIDLGISEQVVRVQQLVSETLDEWIEDLTPSYASILIRLRGDACLMQVKSRLESLLNRDGLAPQDETATRLVDVPVWYDARVAPDLAAVCDRTGLNPDQLIELHSAQAYRIFAIGFAPGFCFLGPLSPQLQLPRQATPRLNVPAGSVAIAGQQTAVYPCDTPGGWHIIGRTPINMQSLALDSDPALQIGDQIRFKPICEDEWDAFT